MSYEVIHGDSLIEFPKLGLERKRVAIITDNPYGMDNDSDYTRFSGGLSDTRHNFERIAGDARPFDPSYWLQFPYVTLWGYNHIAQRLPVGTVLVWTKKLDSNRGNILSDCEIGWQKGGCGIYQFDFVWDGFNRQEERGERYHPNQKPVALMRWCIERQNLPPDTIIVDPYCGCGPTLLAAIQLGFDCIGIDIDSHNCEVARARVKRSLGQPADIPRRITRERDMPLFAMGQL
jgi:site-specific DNA-methyltransferase (adenine-specific)